MTRMVALLNGLLIGLALSLGCWVPDMLALATSHVRLALPVALLGVISLTALIGLASWLAARLETGCAAIVVWLAAAGLAAFLIGRLPYDGRNLVIWLMDARFRGLPIYAFDEAGLARMLLAGFFVAIYLVVFGLLQSYRLEGIQGALNRGRLSVGAAVRLAMPLPLAILVGLGADSMVSQPLRVAPQLVAEAIEAGLSDSDDLFQLGQQRSRNYAAVQGVRGQLSAGYALLIADIDLGAAETVFVLADFDNSAWIHCRVLAGQLSHCYDARLPYTRGLSAMLTGEIITDCAACSVSASDPLRAWLRERGSQFGGPPQPARLGQWGSHVLMRAADPAGGQAIDCLFQGISPVTLVSCEAERP
jgi:hypothetical protein